MAFDLAFALLLVLANGFFVATEFGLARVRPTQVADWEAAGRPGARSVRHAVDHIDAYLAACQLGITLASIGLGVVGKPVFEELLDDLFGEDARAFGLALSGAAAFGIITLLHVVVGELSPKSVAIARTERTALVVAPVMRAFYLATKPLVDLFNGMGNLLLKPFGIPPAREAASAPHSEAELHALVRESGSEGVIEPEEQAFAENALAFDERRVREIMRPRHEVVVLTVEDEMATILAKTQESGHTRMPLVPHEGDLEDTIGMVHVKDLLPLLAGTDREPDLRALARPLPRISESTILSELLREFRRRQQHMALVVDEYGTVLGLVTLEDALEELVGEIEDEFDREEAPDIRMEGDSAVVAGSTPVRELEEELGLELDDPHEATAGGYLLERLGRLPDAGERVDLAGRSVEILEVAEGRIRSLRVDGARDANH